MARSYKSIYSALVANLVIAIIKFIAGTVSHSSAMIAEGIHSLVDTVNELLLLFGNKQGKKPADEERPFGYGREIFFWSFIVSILIFGLGGGLSIYQGIIHILHPEPPGNPFWNYIVIFCSIVFEGTSFIIAAKEFNKVRGDLSWWQAIRQSKDPSSFVVLFEDGAAVTGLFVVLICVFLSHRLNDPHLDGVASLIVGLLLVGVSGVLARESRSLLMGEGIKKSTQRRVIAITEDQSVVVKMRRVFSIYLSPDEVLLMLSITFKNHISMDELNTCMQHIREQIQHEFPVIRNVVIQPEFNST